MTSDVFNVDCMEYMRTLPDKAFQLAIADPPYHDENDPFRPMRGTSKRRQVFSTGRPSEEFFEELQRVSENQIIWGANNFGFEFKGFVAWNKMITGSPRYSQVEIASLSEGLGTVSSYVEIPTQTKENKPHLTQKPVALYAWLLRKYAKPGDRIFDPMLGSGSSRIAAYKMGFDYVGCARDEEYFTKGCERFDRECKGIYKLKDGRKAIEQSLFD